MSGRNSLLADGERLHVADRAGGFFPLKDELGHIHAEVFGEDKENRIAIVRPVTCGIEEFCIDFEIGVRVYVERKTLRSWCLPGCRFPYWASRVKNEEGSSPTRILLWPRPPWHADSVAAKKQFTYVTGNFTLVIGRERFAMISRDSGDCVESQCGAFLLERSYEHGGGNDSFRVTFTGRTASFVDLVASVIVGCVLFENSMGT